MNSYHVTLVPLVGLYKHGPGNEFATGKSKDPAKRKLMTLVNMTLRFQFQQKYQRLLVTLNPIPIPPAVKPK